VIVAVPEAKRIGHVTSVRRVGRYEILRVIGRGGMATVYLAHEPDLDRNVALKELTLTEGPERDVARRFLREARLTGSFSHPNIVTVHDYFEQDGAPYIAMEYLPRGPLRPYVGHLTQAQIGGVLEGVLAGLAYAEERSVVHRDLKPENLMVTSQGRVKIADFGIAKATSATQTANLTTAGTTLGTPRYMAPERALGQELGPWSDLYSVGVIAFELLVGRTPFHDTLEPMAVLLRQINDPIPSVISLAPDVDADLSDWVARLLIKAPEERTRSAVTAWDELDEILIDRLGPRWQRDAALADRPDGTFRSAVTPVLADGLRTAATLAPSVRPERAKRGRGPRGAAGAAGAAAAGLAGAAGAAAAGAAGTARTARAPRAARPPLRWARGRLVLLALGALIAVTFAAGRVLDGRSPATGGGLTPQLTTQSAELSDAKSPSERRKAATGLAEEYERSANDLRSKGADSKTVAAVDRTARAYRRAASAVRRNDESDYDDAVDDAHAGERAIERTTRSQDDTGEEQSDDPSDDEGEEEGSGEP
jgi:hypothetical protein